MNPSNPTVEQTTIVNEPKPTFTHDQLLKALYWVYDLFDRAVVPIFLTDITAESMMKDGLVEGDAIYIGVRHNAWHSGSLRILEAFALSEEIEKDLFKYACEGVPIYVRVYKDHPCITGLDTRMWHREFFNLPNPYSLFLEIYKS